MRDLHCQGPKHVVDLYVVNYIYISLPSNKVVLDKYIHFILVHIIFFKVYVNIILPPYYISQIAIIVSIFL